MTVPNQIITIRDPGLGFIDEASQVPVLVGPCSSGTANTVYIFNDPTDVVTTLGEGPVVQLACFVLVNGGGPVIVVKSNVTTAAASGAVTKGNGASPTVTLSGSPRNDYSAQIAIVDTGILGTATFKYTLDGVTFSPTITVPAGGTYSPDKSGITATFAAGTYTTGDTYTWTSTAGIPNASQLDSAFDAVIASQQDWRFGAVASVFADAAASATAAGGITTAMATQLASFNHRRVLLDCGSNSLAATVLTGFAAVFTDERVAPVYGRCVLQSAAPYMGYETPSATPVFVFAAMAARALASTDLARYASGALPTVTSISHDEDQLESGLDNAKIGTLRTWPHSSGFYITNCYLKSAVGSDFVYWQHGIVFDIACDTVYEAQLPYMNASVRVLTDGTGKINPLDAADIDRVVNAKLRARLTEPENAEGRAGHVSGLAYGVDLNYNTLTNSKVRAKLRMVPLGYVKAFEADVGFSTTTEL